VTRLLAVLALAALSVCEPLGVAANPAVETGTLPHGGTYFVQTDTTSPTAAVDVWFRAPDDGYGAPVPGLARVAATAAAAATLASGRSLAETVAQDGGLLTIEVFPDITGISVVVPAPDARMILASLTAAYFAPSIDANALHAGLSDATVLAVQQQYETGSLAHALLFQRLFASGPAHDPPVPLSPAEVAHMTLADVTAYAQRAFRSANAFVTLAGDVSESDLAAITDGSGPAAGDAPVLSRVAPQNAQPLTQSGSLPGFAVGWAGPPIRDERAATALDFVADYLFRPGSGTLARAVERENAGVQVGGQFITLNDPGVMAVQIEGSDDEAMLARVLSAVKAMEQPLSPEAFAAAREAFLYHVSVDTQTAEEQAGNLGWYATEGAASYAVGGAQYESVARSLDPQYVASVVRRYLGTPAIVRITPNTAPSGVSS
jgi:predicted Zn-dependent peptidase